MSTSLVDRLVADSERGLLLGQSTAFDEAGFDPEGAREAVGQVLARPDATSFHLLLALRRTAPEAYAGIPAAVRAAVLVGALGRQRQLNDWGWIDDRDHYDGPAAEALLELGDAARPGLAELLDDDRPAPLMGSEAATVATLYGYRRCDWAYHLLSRLTGRTAAFPIAPADRDAEIAALRRGHHV